MMNDVNGAHSFAQFSRHSLETERVKIKCAGDLMLMI